MNYPKPDIFDPTLKETAKGYISVPGYKFAIEAKAGIFEFQTGDRFSGVDGFDNLSDEGFMPTAQLVGSVNKPVEPFELIVSNTDNRPATATLFHSFYNAASTNFNNPPSINVRTNSDINYLQYLRQTENVPCRIGAIQYEIISKPDSVSDITIMESLNLRWGRVDANGTPSPVYYIPIRTSPQQFIQSIVQVQSMAELTLDGCAGFNIDMPAHTVVKLTFYPLAQRMTQRLANPELLRRHLESTEERRQIRSELKANRREAKIEARNRKLRGRS